MGNYRFLLKIIAIIFLGVSTPALSSPSDDLASPDQATRDAAAKILRQTYVPPERKKWESLLNKMTPGMTTVEMSRLLEPYFPPSEGSASGGGGTTTHFRLDDRWILECGTDDRQHTLIAASLVENFRLVWVAPPKNFTGTWTVYRINGHKSEEVHYKNGTYFGELIMFNPDGTKGVVQHYDQTGNCIDDTGYYPSGKVSYRARNKNGNPYGIVTWYREDGSVSKTEDRTK